MAEDVVNFELGRTFHVTDPSSLFGGGVPVGFNCPGEGCPICSKPPDAVGVVTAVDYEAGEITVTVK